MTELLTAAQMRAVEAAAMESGTVTGLELMERAGAAVVEAVAAEWPEHGPGSGATVLCGPGNNGGDGFVIARLLMERGWRVRVLAVPSIRRGPDATEARRRWKRAGGRRQTLPFRYELLRGGDRDARPGSPRRPEDYQDLYVDAVLGTGARGPMTGDVGDAMAYLAGSGGDSGFFRPRLVAVDVPSGLDADSGRVPGHPADEPFDPFGSAVPAARLTVTFDSPKPGHVLGIGPDLCGRVVVADIGLERFRVTDAAKRGRRGTPSTATRPERLSLVHLGRQVRSGGGRLAPITEVPDSRRMVTRSGTGSWLAALVAGKRGGHKYDHGHALVLSGGVGRGGAARMTARGALRIGAGAVTLGCPPAALIENASRVDAVMTRPLRDADALAATLKDARIDALALGPGLGTEDREAALVRKALAAARATVLDADALTLLARDDDLFAALHDRCVLTPHMGEFARLFPDLAERLSGPRRPEPVRREDRADFERLRAGFAEANAWQAALAAERAPLYSKVDAARDAAARAGCVVLLKGPDTVIAEPSGRAAINSAAYERAAPWLATAGAGDVLAGFIAGLLARGLGPMQAAEAAAWLHVECALEFGPGLIAEDLPDTLPRVLRRLGV